LGRTQRNLQRLLDVANAQIAVIGRRATELARGSLRQRMALQSICTLGSTEVCVRNQPNHVIPGPKT
jgi:hypothetical protein